MKTTIKIPENLSEVTLVQYQAFLNRCAKLDGDLLKQRMVEHFCNIELSNVLLISRNDVVEIAEHINDLFTTEKKLIPRFKIGKVEFGFIPDLEEISWGEYMDLDKYINNWDDMHKAMAVMYRPIVESQKDGYLIEKYEGTDKYSEVMKLAPLDVALGAMVFFYDLGNELLRTSLRYLTEQVLEETSQNSNSSMTTGDGIAQSIELLTETLEDLTRLRNTNWQPF